MFGLYSFLFFLAMSQRSNKKRKEKEKNIGKKIARELGWAGGVSPVRRGRRRTGVGSGP
jgi:hypothetical protein